MPAIDEIYNNNYFIEQRSVIHLTTDNPDFNQYPHVLNEIAILKQDSSSMLVIDVCVNGEFLSTYQADGLIIATPTGSTAYSLSAGGPLLKPDAQMIAITPICPHSLSGRPAVVSHSDIITIKLENSPHLMIAYDGEYILKSKQKFIEITVQASKYTANIIRTCNLSFYELFRKKMT